MFLIWSFLTIPKHIFSISIFISLQRDDHLCWNFLFDLLRASDLVLSKLRSVFLVICCSDFVSRRDLRLSLILRVNQCFRWSWIMIRYAGCFGIMMDFFKQPPASVQIEAVFIFELFEFFLITSADSVYFCAFVLFWLEIRLITIFPVCYW